jgi:hypothetical protein
MCATSTARNRRKMSISYHLDVCFISSSRQIWRESDEPCIVAAHKLDGCKKVKREGTERDWTKRVDRCPEVEPAERTKAKDTTSREKSVEDPAPSTLHLV